MADRVTRWARPDGAPLVTVLGASGFIGRAVVADLTRRGYRVRAVGRRRARLPEAGPATEP
ncbi:NAD-dependent epimerase/dehydratase family protein, partial [Nakamurella sp.]|uniref:NAD-dependent epimerase/dehydratase family protein n=1 Tax=Nakamurella sp. TaxID=1869182 RepID=UPI003B3A2182